MKEQIRIEAERMLRSRLLYVSLIIGCAIALVQFAAEVWPAAANPLKYYGGYYDSYPYTVFSKWIGGSSMSPYALTYRIILPMIATMPYALTYHMDIKSGYVKNVYSRTRRINYLAAKYIVTFISAGCVAVIPYLLNLYATSCVLPSLTPVKNGTFPIRAICMFQETYYSHPYGYIALYMLIYFLYAGIFASVALAAARLVENVFLLTLVPFIIYYGLGMTSSYLTWIEWIRVTSPVKMMDLCQASGIKLPAVVVVGGIVGIISAAVYFGNGVKRDAL